MSILKSGTQNPQNSDAGAKRRESAPTGQTQPVAESAILAHRGQQFSAAQLRHLDRVRPAAIIEVDDVELRSAVEYDHGREGATSPAPAPAKARQRRMRKTHRTAAKLASGVDGDDEPEPNSSGRRNRREIRLVDEGGYIEDWDAVAEQLGRFMARQVSAGRWSLAAA